MDSAAAVTGAVTPVRAPEHERSSPAVCPGDRLRQTAFIAFQAGGIAAITWVGWSPVAIGVAAVLYLVRMFAITGFYHRYFSHRAFRTGRVRQAAFAALGCSAMQKGPLWWAAHHRHHHRVSDRPADAHSPVQHGVWWSHYGWFLSASADRPDPALVRDLAAFPELAWLDRHHLVMPVLLAAGCYALGALLAHAGVATSGPQMLIWGFFISTTALANATYAINSLAHRVGSRRYATADDSRNNVWLALLTLGEGWHNNHHRYPAAARQGFRWYEIDVTWWILRLLQGMRIIHGLRPVPRAVLEEGCGGSSGGRAGPARGR